MEKRLLVLFIFVLLVNFSQASQTIKVVSIPNSVVELTLIEHTSSYMQVIKRLNQTTNKEGEVTFIYDETLPSEIDIYTKVKKRSYVLFSNKFFSQPTDKPISLFLFPEGTAIPNLSSSNLTVLQISNNLSMNNSDAAVNTTNTSSDLPASQNNIQEKTQNFSSEITGATITENSTNKNYAKYIFYIIAIGIILGMVISFFYKKNHDKSPPFQHHGKVVLKEHLPSPHDLTQDNNMQSQPNHKKYSSSNQEFLKLKKQRRMDELKKRMQQDLDEFKKLENEF